MLKIEDKIGMSDATKEWLERIRKIVNDKWENARDFKIPYTAHDKSHCEKIESILSELLLLDDNEGREAVNAFKDNEKFLLLASVWLHDIGMCPNLNGLPDLGDEENRKIHHKRSAEFIKQDPELQGLLKPEDRDRLSTICALHRKSDQIPHSLYDKIRLIIAYLRMADALHVPDRAPLKNLRTHLAYGMGPVSKYHWIKSFYVTYAGPSRKEFQKLIIKFKKPLNWGGAVEKDLSPLIDIVNTELQDELDSVKEILVAGKLKYNLPVYTEVVADFDTSFLTNDEIADLKELLDIIELFNPTISPNSGKIIDIVLNQLERCMTIEQPQNLDEKIQSLQIYMNNTLTPLLKERPCHAYLWVLQKELSKRFNRFKRQVGANRAKDVNLNTQTKIKWIGGIQDMIRALKWWRKELERNLPKEVSNAKIINKDDSLLLYGYSSSVILVLSALDDDIKKNIEVFVCECSTKTKHRFDNQLVYCDGMQYVRELKEAGIEKIYFVPDTCASNLFSRKKNIKVLFGANAIDSKTGEVFHGLGHLAIADMATTYDIPVYIIAEGLKIKADVLKSPGNQRKDSWYPTNVASADDFRGITFYNPREDVVPRKKIREIITEMGRYDKTLSLTELSKISTNISEVVNKYRMRYQE